MSMSRQTSSTRSKWLIFLLVGVVLVTTTDAFVTPSTTRSSAPHHSGIIETIGVQRIRYNQNAISLTSSLLRESNLKEKGETEVLGGRKEADSTIREKDTSLAVSARKSSPDEENMDVETTSFVWPVSILLLCWSVTFVSALDRVAMSVAMLPLATEFGYTESIKGSVSSLFSVGYGIGILPIGIALSVVSPRLIMGVGIMLWSLATIATPSMANGGILAMTPLLATRAAVGAAESVALPTLQRILSEWIPADRKSLAVAVVLSGFQAGTVVAYLASPYVMDWTGGWRGLFLTYGTMGLALLVPWLLFAKDAPENEPSTVLAVSDDSLDGTADSTADDSIDDNALQTAIESFQSAPIGEMLSSKGVQAILIAHAANNWGLYNNLAWTPTFYAEQYGLNVKDSALYSILPSVAGAIGGLAAGYTADAWLRRDPNNTDERTTRIRKIFQGVALYGPAIFLGVLAHDIPEQPWVAQALLTGSVGMSAFNAAGYGPAVQEKAGSKWSGLLYSLTSLPGVMLGSLGVYATGQILDLTHQDWSIVFSVNALVNVAGATGFVALYNATKEFD